MQPVEAIFKMGAVRMLGCLMVIIVIILLQQLFGSTKVWIVVDLGAVIVLSITVYYAFLCFRKIVTFRAHQANMLVFFGFKTWQTKEGYEAWLALNQGRVNDTLENLYEHRGSTLSVWKYDQAYKSAKFFGFSVNTPEPRK